MKDEGKLMFPIVLKGEVVHGKALGRTVGMPTANISVDVDCLPEAGVYATRIEVEGCVYDSVTNIGKRPSVDDSEHITVETYILDFQQMVYGDSIVVSFVEFIRPERKFSSVDELKKACDVFVLCVKLVSVEKLLNA